MEHRRTEWLRCSPTAIVVRRSVLILCRSFLPRRLPHVIREGALLFSLTRLHIKRCFNSPPVRSDESLRKPSPFLAAVLSPRVTPLQLGSGGNSVIPGGPKTTRRHCTGGRAAADKKGFFLFRSSINEQSWSAPVPKRQLHDCMQLSHKKTNEPLPPLFREVHNVHLFPAP